MQEFFETFLFTARFLRFLTFLIFTTFLILNFEKRHTDIIKQ